MEESEIFRFSEEHAKEAQLRGMTATALSARLSDIAQALPSVVSAENGRREAISVLSVLEREIARFLTENRGTTDVFGHLRNNSGFYEKYCDLQTVLREGIGRLENLSPQKSDGKTFDGYTEWALLRLSQGVHPDPDITAEAGALLGRLREIRDRQTQENGRAERLRDCLRVLMRETVPAYCERSMLLSDMRNGGKAMQAGPLLDLVGELNTAIGGVKRTIERI